MSQQNTKPDDNEEVITIDHGGSSNSSAGIQIDVGNQSPGVTAPLSPVSSDITSKSSEEIKKISSAYNNEQTDAALSGEPSDTAVDNNRGIYSNQFTAPEATQAPIVLPQDLGPQPVVSQDFSPPVFTPPVMVESTLQPQAPAYLPPAPNNYQLPATPAAVPISTVSKPIPKQYIVAIGVIAVLLIAILVIFFVKA